ncbi:hypothetical protein Acr_15g0006070 [Actinidia rufa]|uniref:Uncharacterized protein n=1 Tax=Actinidia rufa TaxID=165716 RepID=A0A7J0FVN5_9ERIC|nr:hypothetical protein Acr_15g0006070 [Actinidia rufa]
MDVRSLERLLIPVEQAIGHFSPQAIGQENYEEKINISDPLNFHFSMKLRYDISESAFVLEKDVFNWFPGLIQLHSLKPMDVFRFYRPVNPLYNSHYLIDYVKRSWKGAHVPEFRRENYLFQVKITADSTNVGSLVISKDAVRTHFPAVGIPAETHAKERLYFSDAYKKEWIGEITVSGGKTPSYVLTFGAAFVSAYLLEVEDAIRFYRPVQPLNSRHFLIEILGRGEAGTDPSQSGSPEDDGDGDDSGQGGGCRDDGTRGDDNRQGDGQGGGRKGSASGWNYLCGMKKFTRPEQSRSCMQLGSSGDLIYKEEDKIAIKGI